MRFLDLVAMPRVLIVANHVLRPFSSLTILSVSRSRLTSTLSLKYAIKNDFRWGVPGKGHQVP